MLQVKNQKLMQNRTPTMVQVHTTVTQNASGRTARIEGESRADIINKLTTRYPDSTEADYTIEKVQA
jgi:hypothetical protein